MLQMLPDRASLDDERARDLGVREAVCDPKHHLTLAWRQLGCRLRIERCQPTTVSGGTIESCEMWAEDPHDHPFAATEISAAIDADLRSPLSRGIEVDVDLIHGTGIAKVRVEIRALPKAAAEDVRQHHGNRPIRVLVAVELNGSSARPNMIGDGQVSVPGARLGASHAFAEDPVRMVHLEEKGFFAVHEVRESVEQLGRERRRPLDLVSFLQEFQCRLGDLRRRVACVSKIRLNANRHNRRIG